MSNRLPKKWVIRFILETVVGRARWRVQASGWREATILPTGVGKAERERSRYRFSGFTNSACPLRVQRKALAWTCQRVRSARI